MAEPVRFDRDAAARIAKAVTEFEDRYVYDLKPGGGPRPLTTEVMVARATTGTADGDGNYSAVITRLNTSGYSYEDLGVVKIRPLNSETVTNNSRYAVRPVGANSSGVPVYVITGAGTVEMGSGSLTVEDFADGNPSIAGVSILGFDSGSRLRVTNLGSGYAKIDIDGVDGQDQIYTTHVDGDHSPAVLRPGDEDDRHDERQLGRCPDRAGVRPLRHDRHADVPVQVQGRLNGNRRHRGGDHAVVGDGQILRAVVGGAPDQLGPLPGGARALRQRLRLPPVDAVPQPSPGGIDAGPDRRLERHDHDGDGERL
jgi:hypothetical protein